MGKAIHLEAENGQLTGATVATARAGYTGPGYVTGLLNDGDKIVLTVPAAPGGLYAVTLRYSAPEGPKGYDLVVNGAVTSGMFEATRDVFATQSAGRVELMAGANTVEIRKGWGHYDVDALDLTPIAAPPPPKPVSARPVDPQATPQARALLARLVHLYGQGTLSGQHETGDTAYIRQITGVTPAIQGGDFIEYSPSRVAHGADAHGETEKIIAAAKAGQVVTMVWHWNAPSHLTDTPAQPWYFGFYTRATSFNLQDVLAHPQSADYQLLLRDLDVTAAQLEKFQAAGVPVLWRPLHEAQGGWFWWGAQGPEPFKQLWRLMYDRFTRVHHLHNLLWVDCHGLDPAWYPGDQYVDIVATDAYPSDVDDPLTATWDTLLQQHDGHKLIALTEFGGVPDVAKMRRFGVYWSYFASWQGDLGPRKLTPSALTALYTAPAVRNAPVLLGIAPRPPITGESERVAPDLLALGGPASVRVLLSPATWRRPDSLRSGMTTEQVNAASEFVPMKPLHGERPGWRTLAYAGPLTPVETHNLGGKTLAVDVQVVMHPGPVGPDNPPVGSINPTMPGETLATVSAPYLSDGGAVELD